MKLVEKRIIEKDIIGVSLSVSELGSEEFDAEAEKELLGNFTKTIEYGKIDFTANMKLDASNIPVITEDSVGDGVVQVTIPDLINKSIVISEDMNVSLDIDINKIGASDLNDVLKTPVLLAQARIILFSAKVKEAIAEKLAEIRILANTFEGETEFVI